MSFLVFSDYYQKNVTFGECWPILFSDEGKFGIIFLLLFFFDGFRKNKTESFFFFKKKPAMGYGHLNWGSRGLEGHFFCTFFLEGT